VIEPKANLFANVLHRPVFEENRTDPDEAIELILTSLNLQNTHRLLRRCNTDHFVRVKMPCQKMAYFWQKT